MGNPPTIAIVGASARAAAFSAMRAGYQVVTADLFADADLQRHCPATRISPYPDGLFNWLANGNCDAWMVTGALENRPELIDAMATKRRLLGATGNTLRKVRSPLTLAAALSEAGLLFPETRTSRLGLPHDGPWLAKTYRGSSGSGVRKLAIATENDSDFFQRRVPGVPLSAVYVGANLLGVTRQLVGEAWTGASEFQYCGSMAPWPVSVNVTRQLCQIGDVLNTTFELKGLYGVDLMLDGENLWTIEVNPRYTAAVEVVERALGISTIPGHLAAYQMTDATQQPPAVDSENCVGKAILFAKSSLEITPEQTEWLCEEAGDYSCPKIADIPVPGTRLEFGHPVLTVFAHGKTCAKVSQKLEQRVNVLEKRLFNQPVGRSG